MKKVAILFLSALLLSAAGYSKDVAIEPSDDYKTIDVRLTKETNESLQKPKSGSRDELIRKITGSSENYAPPVFYVLSSTLFSEGRKDEAMFWFYAGQLRGRIDANLCAYQSAGVVVDMLNDKYGPEINQYAFKNIPNLTNTVEKVLAWEEKTGCNYDRRWVNLFCKEKKSPLSLPKEQWEAIRKKTRDNYRSSFYQALKAIGH